jgi:Rrf2 family protein
MRLTRTSGYAVQALDYLVSQPGAKPVASHLVAQARGIPGRQVLTVLERLVGARILRSLTGPHGGYWLARAAKDVTLLDVIEATGGPIRGEATPVGQGEASAALDRRLQQVCDEAAALVRGRLAKVTLAELARAR